MTVTPEILKLETALGCFSALSVGSGPTVMCLHGFPDNNRSFRYQIPALCSAGYRVVVPTMRGYEPSTVQTSQNYYVHQLAEDVLRWMDFLRVERVHLIGHDWGAITAHAIAALAPDRLKGMSVIAVPHLRYFLYACLHHPKQFKNSWYMQFFQIPGLSDWWVERKDWAFIEYLWTHWSPGWNIPNEILNSVRSTFSQPGVKKAALSYYRCGMKMLTEEGLTSMRLLRAPVTVPTLGVIGVKDGCIDPDVFEICMNRKAYTGTFHLERIDNAGHFAHLEQPNRVNRVILDWIRRCEVV